MTVTVTCRFCKGYLIEIGTATEYNSKDFKTISHTRRCNRCQVTQSFKPNGEATSYSFEVLPYILLFDLKENTFTIRERSDFSKIILQVNHIPHNMTPQNITLEKVKTLILFS